MASMDLMFSKQLNCVELFSNKFAVNSVLAGRYVVERVVREGNVYQLVHAKDLVDGVRKVVRVVNRSTVSHNILIGDLLWLRSLRTDDGRFWHSKFYAEHRDSLYVYIVFCFPRKTLRDVLADEKIYLSARHVKEISHQALRAVIALHDELTLHTDICPENIELVSDDVVSYSVYCADGSFVQRTSLASTEIRLCFYGAVGVRSSVIAGEDQYKSPEAVFGMRYSEKSDGFSLGCLISELLLGRPLFPRCLPGPNYRREKTILFDVILGPFPDDLISAIRRTYSGIFSTPTSDFPEVDASIHRRIRRYAEDALPLRALIDDDVALDLIESMVHLDFRLRVSLRHLDDHPFFHSRE
ncbi:hypothetical protein CVT26_010997 [Gymnopilus dilepis]|uniref:Protein kinase domain-containing protein n=1 Tax=Gymnopilus dilepis TaxID=231916 RepID=A0A409VY89_9AGAR|nr:hypothetical protein CVT26_010997 [Gymnopilus dilepis]